VPVYNCVCVVCTVSKVCVVCVQARMLRTNPDCLDAILGGWEALLPEKIQELQLDQPDLRRFFEAER
jgi:hypothetical protein